MRKTIRCTLVIFMLLASASLSYSESTPPHYEVVELKTPFRTFSFSVRKIYEDGTVLGSVFLKDRSETTCLWNAKGELLSILASSTAETWFGVGDINLKGTVVGLYGPRNNPSHTTAWYRAVGGKVVQYNYPGASATSFIDINEEGDILGRYSLPGPLNSHSFILRRNKELVDLAPLVPNSADTEADYISDSGVIAGRGGDASGKRVPVRWRDPRFPEALSYAAGSAHLITSNGIIAGFVDTGYDPTTPWRRYKKGFFLTPEAPAISEIGEPGFLPYPDEIVLGINSSRQIVGYLSPSMYHNGGSGEVWSVPFIWSPEWGVFNLNKLANLGTRWARLIEAVSINNKGWITGGGRLNEFDSDGNQFYGAFILKPISTASR